MHVQQLLISVLRLLSAQRPIKKVAESANTSTCAVPRMICEEESGQQLYGEKFCSNTEEIRETDVLHIHDIH